MRKYVIPIAGLTMAAVVFSGCGNGNVSKSQDKKVKEEPKKSSSAGAFDFDVDEFYDYNEHEISLSETNSKILNDMIGTLHLNANDYTPDKYAEIVRVSLSARKLEKSKQYSKQDLELLALLNSLDAEIKDNLKALIKSIIAKGGKM